ncbi:hypothetical protein PDESU_06383 [Pontiella desulfatans]|uniref:Uncharacterized protein n=1 Tax=Pontiella desulfatans TaxID=2750659 RepID=A0A6C2UEC8_PONDE|nr:hypothetical protein PDESU_06383 [Pontiella desulfatans]
MQDSAATLECAKYMRHSATEKPDKAKAAQQVPRLATGNLSGAASQELDLNGLSTEDTEAQRNMPTPLLCVSECSVVKLT